MASKRHLKQREAKLSGEKVKAPETTTTNSNLRCPDFCFHFTQSGFTVNECDDNAKIALVDGLWRRSRMTWTEITNAPHTGVGSEKIPAHQLSKSLPRTVSGDVKVIALRFGGQRRLIGYRADSVFHIVWVDPKHMIYKG